MSEPELDRGQGLADAESRLTEGDLDGARAILVKLVRRYPDDDAILAELDRLVSVADAGPEAATYFRTLAAARLARERGDRSVAIRLVAKVRAIWDGDPAIRALAEALEREPEAPATPPPEPEPALEPARPRPPRRSRWGPIAGACGLVAVAGGVAWVLTTRMPSSPAPEDPTPARPAPPLPAPPVERPAVVEPPRAAAQESRTHEPPPADRPIERRPPEGASSRGKVDPRWAVLGSAAGELDRQSPANAAEADGILAKAHALEREWEALSAASPAGEAASIRQTLDRIVRTVSRLKGEFVAIEEAAAAKRADEAKAGIRATVEAWRRAQENLDAAALRRVLPALDEKVQAGLYKNIEWQKVELRDEAIEIAPEGDHATAAYSMRITIQAKKAEAPVVREVKVEARMVREGGSWFIRRTDFKS